MPRRRPSLTIPGRAPLGAPGGGAPAAPRVAPTTAGGEAVVIDPVVWPSAGSINERRTAPSLLEGMDPVEARRIMTERGADRSDDYAALLDSLVRAAAPSWRHGMATLDH